jgi:hypothetical protein
VNRIQGGVVRQIEESLSRELTRAFQDQQRFFEISVIPRTVTPAVSVCESIGGISISDARVNKRRVLDMAKSGDVRGAFTLVSFNICRLERNLLISNIHVNFRPQVLEMLKF